MKTILCELCQGEAHVKVTLTKLDGTVLDSTNSCVHCLPMMAPTLSPGPLPTEEDDDENALLEIERNLS